MADYEWIEKNGIKVMYMKIASRTVEEMEGKVAEFKEVIHNQPAGSLLTITDVGGGYFDTPMKHLISEFVRSNKPYIKMSSVIGVTGLQKVLYSGVLRLSGRKNLVLHDSIEEALEFLQSQQ